MGIVQKLLNMDDYYKTTEGDKIIVNDLSLFSKDDIEKINHNLMTVYNNPESISIRPSCDCGELTGGFNKGATCPLCSTECKDPFDKVQPILWLKAVGPEYRFLNPVLWIMISNVLNERIDYMRYLCDTRYNPPVNIPPYIINIRDSIMGGKRDYPTLMSNLVNILTYLNTLPKFNYINKQTNVESILKLLSEQSERAWSTYLPILNKKLFVVEATTKGKFISLINAESQDVVMTWVKLCSELEKTTPRKISNTLGGMMYNLCNLYKQYIRKYLDSKHGIFRKNVYGARSHFTFRCVIVSIAGKHNHDEIEAPWCVGVTAFRPHILNKLQKLGYKYKDASAAVFAAVKTYDPVIDKILKELLAESKYKGIPVLAQRNPSLLQGSSQLCYITRFKTEPMDMTCGFSMLICKAPNADYDGDELNFTILLDNDLAEEFQTLQPFYNITSTEEPYAISGHLTLLSPSYGILSNYLKDKDNHTTEQDTLANELNFVEVKA